MEEQQIASSQEVEAEGSKLNPNEAPTVPEVPPAGQDAPAEASSPSPSPEGDDELTARFKAQQPGAAAEAPKPGIPREMAVIQKNYDDLCRMAGEAYFARETHERNLDFMMNDYAKITQEAAARAKLDDLSKNSKLAKAEEKRKRKAEKAGVTATSKESEELTPTAPAPESTESTQPPSPAQADIPSIEAELEDEL